MVEASLMQDYNIDVSIDWLKTISTRKFLLMINNLTKDTALGVYFMNKQLSKDKKFGNKEVKHTFDPKNKNSWEIFRAMAKGAKRRN